MTQTSPIPHAELWRTLIDKRDSDARRQLVEAHVRVVKYVAGRMAIGLPHYVEFGDLEASGLLGLIQAVDNFDPTRGIKFETYAIPRIRGAILDELRSQDWIPRSLRRKAKQLEHVYSELESRLGRPATDSEVARELGIDLRGLDEMVDEVSVATIVSLDADLSGDDDEQPTCLGDYLPDPKSEDVEAVVSEREMKLLVANSLEDMPRKEQLVLVLYYYEDLTLKEIGEILDVTESRVCQIHTKAILRLRGRIRNSEGKKSLTRLSRDIRADKVKGVAMSDCRDTDGAPLKARVNIMAGLVLPSMLKLAAILLEQGMLTRA